MWQALCFRDIWGTSGLFPTFGENQGLIFGVGFRTRFGMPLGLLFGRSLGLFEPFWEPWGHLWETFSKMDAKMKHVGARGAT